ncbi:MAG: hypothetical protein LBE18_12705 [Planctomycetaceae bacterium]|jgi:hypothetical protein|nr:hypothetical protein [Planctomycetaceae bacterium]
MFKFPCKIGLTCNVFTIVIPIILSILFFIFVVIGVVLYLIETNIGQIDQAGYWINNKMSIYHSDYEISCYDLTIVCRSEFSLLFNVITFANEQTQQKIYFHSQRVGIYWYVDVTVIVSSDGSVCIFDKKMNVPILQLREICRKNSLIKDNNVPVSWIFEPDFRKNTRILIGTEYGFLDAYDKKNNFKKQEEPLIKNSVFIGVESPIAAMK